MLERRCDSIRLERRDEGSTYPTSQQRVFRETLEVAAPERISMQVYRRRQHNLSALGFDLTCKRVADPRGEFNIPRGSKGNTHRERSSGDPRRESAGPS